MPGASPEPLRPVRLSKEGDDWLVIEWNDCHRGVYAWQHLRNQCPCAGCREERLAPPDPFRILKPSELAPLKPVAVQPVGYYAYKIVWSDGHDAGLFTLESLRHDLCQCPECQAKRNPKNP
jgi:DUF971 family protein